MYLSILGKIGVVLKYFLSSFLGIELFLIVLFLFIFLILNLKRNNDIVKISIPIGLVSILLLISGGFHEYVKTSIDAFIKYVMNYYYFPNLAVYYISALIITVLFIYTILNDNMNKIKRIINYVSFSLIYLCLIGLASFLISNNIELSLDYSIYKYDEIISFVQISNFILLIWLVVTFFWYLYIYFKKKYD